MIHLTMKIVTVTQGYELLKLRPLGPHRNKLIFFCLLKVNKSFFFFFLHINAEELHVFSMIYGIKHF